MISEKFYITEYDLSASFGELFYCKENKLTFSNTYTNSDKINIAVKIPRRLGISAVNFVFYNESCRDIIFSADASWIKTEYSYDIYTLSFNSEKLGTGLFFYDISAASIFGKIYVHKKEDNISFSKDISDNKFQITVSEFHFEKPASVYGGIMYHIFVDRFAKGNKKKQNCKNITNWDSPIPEYPAYPGAPINNTYLYGGDLWGIADRLDYLKALGVSIIYLSPVFESPSNHKYDTSDYMKVDDSFGGDEALTTLIKKAKSIGISIILDGVFNHTGADSRYFNKLGRYDTLGAYNSKKSEYFTWYDFKSYPNSYSCWWGIEILPRINPDIPSLRNFLIGKNGVVEKYMNLGILGFRLDVVDELSDDFVKSIKSKLNSHRTDSYLIGEVWEDASNKIAYGKRKKYYLGSELDGVMNYPIRNGIIDFLKYNNTSQLKYALQDVISNAPERIRNAQMNIIGTHDTERIITVLGGKSSEGQTNDELSVATMSAKEYEIGRKKLLSAYTILATIPGIPSIYYGDEVGMQGYSDPFNRRTFPWCKEDNIILSHYQKIGKIRRENTVYKEGEFKLLYLSDGILIFSRYDNTEAYVTIINNTAECKDIIFEKNSVSLFNDKKDKLFILEPHSSLIVKSQVNTFLEIKKSKG